MRLSSFFLAASGNRKSELETWVSTIFTCPTRISVALIFAVSLRKQKIRSFFANLNVWATLVVPSVSTTEIHPSYPFVIRTMPNSLMQTDVHPSICTASSIPNLSPSVPQPPYTPSPTRRWPRSSTPPGRSPHSSSEHGPRAHRPPGVARTLSVRLRPRPRPRR